MTQEAEVKRLKERLTNARNAVIAAEKAGDPDEKILPLREAIHPDVAKVVWRFGRWHHEVDYKPFQNNKPILKNRYAKRKDGYSMSLVPISGPK